MEDKPAQSPQSAAPPQVAMDVVMPPKPQTEPVQASSRPAPVPTASTAAPEQAAPPVATQPAPKPDAKAPTPKKPKQPRTAPVGVIIIALLVMVVLCTAAVMVYQKG